MKEPSPLDLHNARFRSWFGPLPFDGADKTAVGGDFR